MQLRLLLSHRGIYGRSWPSKPLVVGAPSFELLGRRGGNPMPPLQSTPSRAAGESPAVVAAMMGAPVRVVMRNLLTPPRKRRGQPAVSVRAGHSTRQKATPDMLAWLERRVAAAPNLMLLELQQELRDKFGVAYSVASVSRLKIKAQKARG